MQASILSEPFHLFHQMATQYISCRRVRRSSGPKHLRSIKLNMSVAARPMCESACRVRYSSILSSGDIVLATEFYLAAPSIHASQLDQKNVSELVGES